MEPTAQDDEQLAGVLARAFDDVTAWITEIPASFPEIREGLLDLRREIADTAGVPILSLVRSPATERMVGDGS